MLWNKGGGQKQGEQRFRWWASERYAFGDTERSCNASPKVKPFNPIINDERDSW
jgi:hypothetical protein